MFSFKFLSIFIRCSYFKVFAYWFIISVISGCVSTDFFIWLWVIFSCSFVHLVILTGCQASWFWCYLALGFVGVSLEEIFILTHSWVTCRSVWSLQVCGPNLPSKVCCVGFKSDFSGTNCIQRHYKLWPSPPCSAPSVPMWRSLSILVWATFMWAPRTV